MHLLAAVALAGFKSRAALQLENLALRHQLGILHRSVGEEAKTDLVRSTALGLGYVSLEPLEVDLVNLIEDGHHGLLNNLILQRRDAQRTLSPVGLRNVDSS